MFVFCLTHNLMLLHLLIHSKLLVFYMHWVSASFHAQKSHSFYAQVFFSLPPISRFSAPIWYNFVVLCLNL